MALGPTKLGVSFHRTFPLSRITLREVLAAAVERGDVSDSALRDATTLGTEQVHSARRYALGAGLISDKENLPTPFGKLAYDQDAALYEPETQWIIHYHFATPKRNGPLFWNCAVCECLHPGAEFSSSEFALMIQEKLESAGELQQVNHLREAATAFLRTYAIPDGLGALRLVREIGDARYSVADPQRPSTAVVAYVLADYWEGMWGEVKTVELGQINAPGGPTSLLLSNSGEMSEMLREMQSRGLVEVHRRVPPYTVVRLWESADDLLHRVYNG